MVCSLQAFSFGKNIARCVPWCVHTNHEPLCHPQSSHVCVRASWGQHLRARHAQAQDVLSGSLLPRSSLTSSCSFFRDFFYLERPKSHPRMLLSPAPWGPPAPTGLRRSYMCSDGTHSSLPTKQGYPASDGPRSGPWEPGVSV